MGTPKPTQRRNARTKEAALEQHDVPDDIASLAPLVRRMRERIRAMEQSRFWTFRNTFFALKKRLRLSADGAWPPFALPAGVEAALAAQDPYAQFLRLHAPRDADLARMRDMAHVFPRRPVISIVCAGPAVAADHFRATLDSMSAQAYENWQFCIAPHPGEQRACEELTATDKRPATDARVVLASDAFASEAAASAAALAKATGGYVGFMRRGDALTPDALFEIVLLLNRHAGAEIIYSDEDTFGAEDELRDPYFKPDWSPELLLSRMYIGDLCVYRRALIEQVLDTSAGWGPAFTYDLALRATEETERIYHIPRVLYHRRASPERSCTAPDSSADSDPALHALTDALERRGEGARVVPSDRCTQTYVIRYAIRSPGKVSIIIPTRDHGADVERCLASIVAHSGSADFEVLVVDNRSTDPATLETFTRWQERDARIRVRADPQEFNFSGINNRASEFTSGKYLLFLNNDTEVRSDDWLAAMIEQAQRPPIAAVGARLLFPDDSVQHAGVVLGIGGVAGHSQRFAEAGSTGYFCSLESVCNYSAVSAACMMVRRELFEKFGGFDEAFSVAFNDVDLCLRFRERGYRNVYLPHVVLTHAESKTRGHDLGFRKSVRSAREQLLMKERWDALLDSDPYYSPNLTRRSEDYAIRLDELIP